MNNRLIGIIGASLIIAGVFLPIINLIIFTPSLFTVIVGSFPPALPRIPPVAKRMECSIGTVMSRLFYARRKMATLLAGLKREELR